MTYRDEDEYERLRNEDVQRYLNANGSDIEQRSSTDELRRQLLLGTTTLALFGCGGILTIVSLIALVLSVLFIVSVAS